VRRGRARAAVLINRTAQPRHAAMAFGMPARVRGSVSSADTAISKSRTR
jgi:hypothetical protein